MTTLPGLTRIKPTFGLLSSALLSNSRALAALDGGLIAFDPTDRRSHTPMLSLRTISRCSSCVQRDPLQGASSCFPQMDTCQR